MLARLILYWYLFNKPDRQIGILRTMDELRRLEHFKNLPKSLIVYSTNGGSAEDIRNSERSDNRDYFRERFFWILNLVEVHLFIHQMVYHQFSNISSILPRSLDTLCNITQRNR